MNKLKTITKILRKYGENEVNLLSEDARKIVALEILEAIDDE